jgi:hypothetical protein
MQEDKIHPSYDKFFITKSFNMIQKFLETTLKGENKVINFKLPDELNKAVDFKITKEPCPDEELLKTC